MTLTAPDARTADREAAIAHFAAKLRFETDPSDVIAAQDGGERFTFVDVRGHAAWHQGRAVGALHIPRQELDERAAGEIPLDAPVVVYCWGPACNGATKAALTLSKLGYEVREMIGGFEYWAREGLAVEDDRGRLIRAADPLTVPVSQISCDC